MHLRNAFMMEGNVTKCITVNHFCYFCNKLMETIFGMNMKCAFNTMARELWLQFDLA